MGPLFNYGVSGLREDRTLETKTGPTLNGDGDGDGLRGLKLLDEDRDEGATQGLRGLWLRVSVTRTN